MIFYILYYTVDAVKMLDTISTTYLHLTLLCKPNNRIIIAKYFYLITFPTIQVSKVIEYFSFYFFLILALNAGKKDEI